MNAIRRELDQLDGAPGERSREERDPRWASGRGGRQRPTRCGPPTRTSRASAEAISATVSEVLAGNAADRAAAQESGTAAAQAAIAARQQSQGVEELAAAIEEIALLAEELQASGS